MDDRLEYLLDEPIIEELDAPNSDPIHNNIELNKTPDTVLYICTCGFCGDISTKSEKCPYCGLEIVYINELNKMEII